MRKEIKSFNIKDTNCTIEVEIMSKAKDIFDFLDEYINNLKYDLYDSTDESFQILYKNGNLEYVDYSYDGHKIPRQNIKSMVYNNPGTYMVYGEYEVNENGIVNVV